MEFYHSQNLLGVLRGCRYDMGEKDALCASRDQATMLLYFLYRPGAGCSLEAIAGDWQAQTAHYRTWAGPSSLQVNIPLPIFEAGGAPGGSTVPDLLRCFSCLPLCLMAFTTLRGCIVVPPKSRSTSCTNTIARCAVTPGDSTARCAVKQ
jgi:hypothetical protein